MKLQTIEVYMKILITLFAAVLISSCSGVRLNRSEVLKRETSIAYLEKNIDKARLYDVDVLAPVHFEKAEVLLDKAVKEAQRVKDPKGSNAHALEGLSEIRIAEQVAEEVRSSMAEAIEKRKKAKAVQAHLLFQSEFEALDRKFKSTSRSVEEGNRQAGIRENSTLASAYAALEVRSLKADLSENASKAYEAALAIKAHRMAPETMQKAKSELSIAQKIIDLEKDYDKAKTHAEQALYLASRARYITELIIGFKKEKMTQEQMLLWYQDQLEQVHQGLDSPLSFAQPNREVIASLNESIRSQLTGAHVLVDQQAQQLSQQRDYLKRLAQEINKPADVDIYDEIRKSFDEHEATVVKENQDIIIRLYGFQFDLGKSNILPRHYNLINKITTVVQKVPDSTIIVEGHTDATGSAARNMQLSHERAENFRAYLIKVAHLDETRVQSAGYGSKKPWLSNTNAKNRAKNRRLEIVIKPKQ